jgi:microcystin-dependent protein
LAYVGATTGMFSTLTTNNIIVTSGNITGIINGSALNLQATNFNSSNVAITGGSITGLSNITSTSGVIGNLIVTNELVANVSTSNAVITGGSVTGLTTLAAASATFTSATATSITATGGSVSGLTTLSATTGQVTNLGSSNVAVTGGSVSGVSGSNNTFTNTNLVTSTATTKTYNDNSTAIATTAFVQSVLPMGMIVMWGGATANIPTGWQLCNGSNGTPDLRGQFIVGAGGSYSVGATGGSSSVSLSSANLPGHTHGFTVTGNTNSGGSSTPTATTGIIDPGHSHSYFLAGSPEPQSGSSTQCLTNPEASSAQTGTSITNISAITTISPIPAHQHAISLSGTTQSTGSGTAFSNLPPYYALCYIQKMY